MKILIRYYKSLIAKKKKVAELHSTTTLSFVQKFECYVKIMSFVVFIKSMIRKEVAVLPLVSCTAAQEQEIQTLIFWSQEAPC